MLFSLWSQLFVPRPSAKSCLSRKYFSKYFMPLCDWKHFPLLCSGGGTGSHQGQGKSNPDWGGLGRRGRSTGKTSLLASVCPSTGFRGPSGTGKLSFSGPERRKWEASLCLSAWPWVHELYSTGPWCSHLDEGLMLPRAPCMASERH